jgi:hypothetical protein
MVDVAGDVAPDAGVNHRPVRELEAPDVTVPDVPPLAPEALGIRDLLAGVIDDSRVFRDGSRRIDTAPVDA